MFGKRIRSLAVTCLGAALLSVACASDDPDGDGSSSSATDTSPGGSPSRAGSSSSSTALRETCTTSGDGCSCKTTRSDEPAGISCSAANFDGATCCAGAGWPTRDGSSCACAEAPRKCFLSDDEESCNCVSGTPPPWAAKMTEVATCMDRLATVPAYAGDRLTCCKIDDGARCSCSWTTFSCATNYADDDAMPVQSCEKSDLTGACPSASTKVQSCNGPLIPDQGQGGNRSSGGSGGGTGGSGKAGSSGSGPAPTCSPKFGECEGSGDCACGQSCFATAVCSTCTERCGYSCITDQDCIGLKAKHNLTIGYTRCVKTSPKFEIYKCE